MDQVTISRELLRQVLDAFETYAKQYPHMWKGYLIDAEQALRTALEQPAVEPVAELDLYVDENGPVLSFKPKWYGHLSNGKHNLYAAPQAQQPQLLTHEEIKDAVRHLYQDEKVLQMSMDMTLQEFRAIEAAVLKKNGISP